MSERASLPRSIGTAQAAITLIGFVIGITIFILPGTLAASTGPAVVLAYALAAVMALFSCVVAAQIGSVFPVSGASFVSVSRLVSPFWGFIIVWLAFAGASVAIAILGYGFADYLQMLWSGLDRRFAALALVVCLAGLNLMGMRNTVLVQSLMVAAFMSALAVFCIAGLVKMDTTMLTPFMPNGLSPVLVAAIPAYFSFAGFIVIIEIGGEIKNPAYSIPRALGISFATVLVVYTLVSLTLVGIIPWQELGAFGAPITEAAGRILPAKVATAITITAIAAAATSVNVMLLGYSRDVLALARARVLPSALARTSARNGTPSNAVVFMMLLSLGAVGVGGTIIEYATLVVVGLLIAQIALAIAALRLPKELPQQYAETRFRLGRRTLRFFCVGLIVFSILFLGVVVLDSPGSAGLAGVYFLLGVAYYFWRRNWLRRQGTQLSQLIKEQAHF